MKSRQMIMHEFSTSSRSSRRKSLIDTSAQTQEERKSAITLFLAQGFIRYQDKILSKENIMKFVKEKSDDGVAVKRLSDLEQKFQRLEAVEENQRAAIWTSIITVTARLAQNEDITMDAWTHAMLR